MILKILFYARLQQIVLIAWILSKFAESASLKAQAMHSKSIIFGSKSRKKELLLG